MKFYEYHGYCTARVEEQRKCRNFAECKAGQGICKYSLLGGSCDWEPDMMDVVADIFDGISKDKRRGYGRTEKRTNNFTIGR
jgi:hypothetical protein